MSSSMSPHHDALPLGRGGPHAPAIGRDADAPDADTPDADTPDADTPDAVLARVAAALDSGDPDMIDDAYVTLRRAIRFLLHLPDPTV